MVSANPQFRKTSKKPYQVVTTFTDITERKKAEEKLKESEERFKALFHQNSSVLMLIDPETANIEDVNAKATQFYGYSREQLCRMNMDQINTHSLSSIEQQMQKAMKGAKNYFTFSHRLANGEIKEVEVYTGTITINGKNLLYSTIHDITEQTRNRQRLQKGEKIAKLGHWEIDLNTNNVYASDGAKKIYGLEQNHIKLNDIQQLTLDNYRPVLDKQLKQLIHENRPYDIEFQIQRPSDQRIIDIHSVAEYHQFRNVVFGIIQDVTERKEFEKKLQHKNEELQAAEEELRVSNEELRDINQILEEQKQELEEAKEKAEESDRLKSAFLANMSHEIRTPMNGIMGFSQVLLNAETTKEKQNKFLEIIHSRSKHLLQIINDIVDISKMEANQFSIHKESFNVNDLFNELYDTYQTDKTSYSKSNLSIDVDLSLNRENSFIFTDKQRLRQILTNLISNAIKFTDQGSILFGYKKYTNDQLLFYVKDTGIGISPENHKSIFDRFRQVDDTSNRNHDGTGLGLTISKNLAELLGGELWLESTKGNGSTFYFTIPYQTAEKKEERYTKNKPTNYNWSGKSILIVEDDPTSQAFINALLKPTGANLEIKETGKSALQAFNKNNNFDLILMDIKLPDISGLDVTKQIKTKDESVRIIAQTAYALSEDRKKCKQAGADDYISKPIDPEDLLMIISQHI